MRSPLRISFQTKVLLPVMTIMVLLVVVPMWVVSARMSAQLEAGAAADLRTAEAVFKNLQTLRGRNLLLRCRNLPNEPRFKAVFMTQDPKTLAVLLKEFIDEIGGDVVLLANHQAEPLAEAARDDGFPVMAFARQNAGIIGQTLKGEPIVATVGVGGGLYDVVSVPVQVGDGVVGALLFGLEIGDTVLKEFKSITRSEIVLLSGGQVAASTLAAEANSGWLRSAGLSFGTKSARPRRLAPDTVVIGGEHFVYVTRPLDASAEGTQLGYILLTSFEEPLLTLRGTHRTFLWIQVTGILVGGVLVWVLVRRVTGPLRELHDSAEAVGRGDFSQRVPIRSADECGELAAVFNQMTANLKASREELEKAVQTLQTTQAQLVQSEKLRAIGTLAGGIAHDFNNILGAILGFAELVQDDVAARPRTLRNVRQVLKAGLRARDLVRQILSFSRQDVPQRVPLHLGSIVDETLKLMRATLPTTIEIRTRIETSSDAVVADSTQLHQVLMNLATNAGHAMREHGGVLSVAMEDFEVPTGGCREAPSLGTGPYVRVLVSDTGHGMSREVMERIFEPFFTTKGVGEGTGLGLSVVHGIIENHGGEITVTSEPGRGTTFYLYLPRAAADSVAVGPVEEAVVTGHGRLLVVDDEEALANMMQQRLTRMGYEVAAYTDSAAALAEFENGPEQFDAVITDETMPHLTGMELAREIYQRRPEVPVILCSGSGLAFTRADSLNPAIRACLSKPIDFNALARCIGELQATAPRPVGV